ncbi:MAG: tetratricopeptide repeat protein [Saprospiraceae bacterium]|nr:tetratricopeptide repeat protein [Saprospiraceae bacterium]
MGDYEKAIDTYEKAISLNPYDAKPFYNLGFVYFRKETSQNR